MERRRPKVTEVIPPPLHRERDIRKTRDRLKKIITLSDLHHPDNIDISGIVDLVEDEQPDEIIYIGDVINATGISEKYSKKDFEQGMYDTMAEFESFMEKIHTPLRNAAPNAKFTITLGNHDGQRVDKAINGVPERAKLLDYRKLLPGIRVIPYGQLYSVGELSYTHGAYYGENCAKQMLIATNRNTIFGDTHTVSEYTKKSMVTGDTMFSKTIGCLTDRNPKYRPGTPNSWVNAFHIAYIRKDGKAYEFTIKLQKDGSFVWNGKIYNPHSHGKSKR
jgi:predicted phosphodiesterase